jgi:DNA-nicking Smr family endonuclease
VLISHGKGERSTTPGRLKSFVAQWLIDHPDVIAYCSAQRMHGGVGSVYVLVKKSAAGKAANRERYGLKGEL